MIAGAGRVRRRRERGSATVWVLLAATMLWSFATWGIAVASAAAARSRASTAADLGALAGAALVVRGDPSACAAANTVAARNHATVRACTVDAVARTLELVVEFQGRGLLSHAPPAIARARAGSTGVDSG